MVAARKLNEEEKQRRAKNFQRPTQSMIRLSDLQEPQRVLVLERWNEIRLSRGDPPFAELLTTRSSSIDVRCPYCRNVHRHPWVKVGEHLYERCDESPPHAIGYLAVRVGELRLNCDEAEIAELEGWLNAIPGSQHSLF